MNKSILIRAALLPMMGAMAAGCSENAWNDEYLDGFKDQKADQEVQQVKTVEYTLTADNYSKIASLAANKTLAEELGQANALKAVGKQQYFTAEATAATYVPAFLGSPDSPFFTLTDKSAVKLTFNVAQEAPAALTAVNAAEGYVVTDEDYQIAWESSERYADAFTPSVTAAQSLPAILAERFKDAKAGDMVVVNYQQAAVDPVFSAGETPDDPGFAMSKVVSTIVKGGQYTINGYVTGICTQGYILTDATGSIFVYTKSAPEGIQLMDQVVFSGEASSYNYGLQMTGNGDSFTVEVVGNGGYTYPTAKALTVDEINAIATRTTDEAAIYCSMSGTIKNDGKYINLIIDGTSVQGSPYGADAALKEQLADGVTVTVEGYVMAVASKGKFLNTVITKVTPVSRAAETGTPTNVASEQRGAVWSFNGTRWTAASGYAVLNHSDYQGMGQKYDNLSNDGPDTYLPTYLNVNYPYAQEEQQVIVVYNYYASSATKLAARLYTRTAEGWELFNGVTTETAQFVRTGGKWIYDPNVTIILPAGRNVEISTLYYQTCVDWVKDHVADGAKYVTSYGNNEYYCGTSAYQGNVDLRPASARAQYPAAYESMTNDEIVALMKSRFESEVLPAALSILHPDAAPIPGVTVIYTVNFAAYDGSTTTVYDVRYEVVGQGEFKYLDCTWND